MKDFYNKEISVIPYKKLSKQDKEAIDRIEKADSYNFINI